MFGTSCCESSGQPCHASFGGDIVQAEDGRVQADETFQGPIPDIELSCPGRLGLTTHRDHVLRQHIRLCLIRYVL